MSSSEPTYMHKKNGVLRPIAVSLTLRRLTSKVTNRWGMAQMSPSLAPRQLGWGYPVEQKWWSTRCFLLSSTPWQALVKMDFTNAFNTVRRDSMLESVAQDRPELFKYVSSILIRVRFRGACTAVRPIGSTSVQLDLVQYSITIQMRLGNCMMWHSLTP